jgi:hypothetical protein
MVLLLEAKLGKSKVNIVKAEASLAKERAAAVAALLRLSYANHPEISKGWVWGILRTTLRNLTRTKPEPN